MPENITLKTTTVNAILQYLGAQPVAQLIQAIQQEAQEQLSQAQVPVAEVTEE